MSEAHEARTRDAELLLGRSGAAMAGVGGELPET
jgi:hypothetical protein